MNLIHAEAPASLIEHGFSEADSRDRLVDPFGRVINYVRLSVTDRCNYRCSYCMSEKMRFLAHKDLLSLEELDRLLSVFVGLGTRKIRLTGGEPLVRRNVISLFQSLSRHLRSGALDELTLTTNGSQLRHYAADLAACGVQRVNVSLDTRDAALFHATTRRGDIADVLAGLDAADRAGLRVKLNAVALKGVNDGEASSLVRWAHGRGYDLTFIELMPLGDVEGVHAEQFLPLTQLRATLSHRLTLTPLAYRSGGPARYYHVEETGGRLGFITPLTHSFCADCNRVRIACSGRMYLCLGREQGADLREVLRSSANDADVAAAIHDAIARKPKGHAFGIEASQGRSHPSRSMSVTGG